MMTRIFLGAMTGTSCDGIDVVALEVIGSGLMPKVDCLLSKVYHLVAW